MSPQPVILVVDDDPSLREVVTFALRKAGYAVVEAADGAAALVQFEASRPALVVLDVLMPELDGTEVCRRIRAISRVPIVFLSSRDDEVDRVVGLELGGDDYVTKPFSPRELVARVRAVLRRASHEPPAAAAAGDASSVRERGTMRHGRLALDLDRFSATWDGREVLLTVTEFGILRTLLGRPGRVYTRTELMAGAYEEDNLVSERTMDSHVRRVRRKFSELGADPVETVHGVGYRLAERA
jgi:two-component system OmpR family response regulator